MVVPRSSLTQVLLATSVEISGPRKSPSLLTRMATCLSMRNDTDRLKCVEWATDPSSATTTAVFQWHSDKTRETSKQLLGTCFPQPLQTPNFQVSLDSQLYERTEPFWTSLLSSCTFVAQLIMTWQIHYQKERISSNLSLPRQVTLYYLAANTSRLAPAASTH